jgi:hypothetical protein
MRPWERSLLISVYSIQVSVCLVVYRYTRVIGIDKLRKKCCKKEIHDVPKFQNSLKNISKAVSDTLYSNVFIDRYI